MKWYLFLALALLVPLVSCRQLPIDSLTGKPLPTETPIVYSSAAPSLAPTAGAAPKFYWVSSPSTQVKEKAGWDEPGWNHQQLRGGEIQVVDDARYGKVLKFLITEDTPEVRIQLTKTGPPVSGPCTVRIPVWLSADYQPAGERSWANLFTVLSSTPATDDKGFDVLASIDVLGSLIPNLNVKQPYNVDETLNYWPGKTPLTREQWHLLELAVDQEGLLHLYLDGEQQASGPIHPGGRNAVELLQGGAFGAGLPKGSFILNGPLELICW